jgi:urea transport system ATP-binding protein
MQEIKDNLIQLNSIEVNFDGFKAVNEFNFGVKDGELRCLIGPNGAGKTTVLDIICGKTKSSKGNIIFNGEDITNKEEFIISRKGVGRKFQIPSVFKELTVKENLYVALNSSLGFFSNIINFFNPNDQEKIDKIAEFVVLKEPRLILMDEPTAGMTNYETSQTVKLFNKLKEAHTLIIVEHDMGFVKEISDIVTVMHEGTLLAEGKTSVIENDEKVKKAYLGNKGITNA